ncbi:hypothetical protein HDV02_002870 [Globomyces sp. JEL0801]|nr:hypothetical protein HDV02_002870 [Globomyces sp. JEL0801]
MVIMLLEEKEKEIGMIEIGGEVQAEVGIGVEVEAEPEVKIGVEVGVEQEQVKQEAEVEIVIEPGAEVEAGQDSNDRRRDDRRSRDDRHSRRRSRSRTPEKDEFNRDVRPGRKQSRSPTPPRKRRNERQNSEEEKDIKDKGSPTPNKINDNGEDVAMEDLDEEEQMKRLMGFGGFDTTKNKHVPGADVSATAATKKRNYKQFMNRHRGPPTDDKK